MIMKFLALYLTGWCLGDIIFPTIKMIKTYKKYKKEDEIIAKDYLKCFIRLEIANVLALIFFIMFLIKY